MLWWWQRPRPAVVLVCVVASFVASATEAAVNRDHRGQPSVRARAAVVMDAATGEFLYTKRPDEQLPPASTTKVLTATLALESGRLDERFKVSRSATRVQPSKLHLRVGDSLRLRDLTRAVLLRSANDASVVVAEGLAGSVRNFATKMNRRAAEIGAQNTKFVNPNGLPAVGHLSTARDLALIFRHALDVPSFREIAGTPESRITAWRRKRRQTFYLRNSNRLLRGYRVPVVGKTGYTRAAKRCFVGAASADGREIVVALLGSTDLWGDARRLLDFGLSQPAPAVQVTSEEKEEDKIRVPGVGDVRSPVAEQQSELDEYSLVIRPIHNSRGAAERLRHFVSSRGHRAVIEAVGPESTRRYLVRVVGLRTLDAALRAGVQLQAENLRPRIVPPGSASPKGTSEAAVSRG
jgi:D-alanyl-D-alanine carboxypeptidase